MSPYPFQLNPDRQVRAGAGARTAASPAAEPRSLPGPRRLASADLFGGQPMVLIDHGDVVYRLCRTALGKLILTK